MNEKPRTPSVAELKSAGYVVEIKHNRLHRVAYLNPKTGKLTVKTLLPPNSPENVKFEDVLVEMLPKGGLTEVWVTDPETSAEFYGFAVCREDENYHKSVGVSKALERITGLMLVMDGKEGFKMRLQC